MLFNKIKKDQLTSLQTWFQEEILKLCLLDKKKKTLKHFASKMPSDFSVQNKQYVITFYVFAKDLKTWIVGVVI